MVFSILRDSGEVVYEAVAPDTITSWIASAFAISTKSGLGIAPTTSKLTVFRPFFIRMNLPYSVKRGEKFALQVLVFNYMDMEQDVMVTLKHDEDAGFDFLQKDGTKKVINKKSKSKTYNVRLVSVPGGGVSKAVYFPIVPTKIGNIMLSIVASSGHAGDAIQQPLKVEPEGYRIYRNVPFLVDLRGNSGAYSKKIHLDFPTDIVEGSKTATVTVTGTIMGPVMSNLDSLVRMPYGCGEQNMINFVPNIVVVKYLKAVHREDPAITAKAIEHMRAGYQRELTYKRYDNSFSAFGNSDKHGSTWLTAFVLRSFKQAQQFIYIDEQILQNSIAFLNAQQQQENGAFAERGEVHDKFIQGGAIEGGITLTAYVLIALLENGVKNEKAQHYLEQHLYSVKDDVFALSTVTYALHLADSPKKEISLKMLENHKISDKGKSICYLNGVHWSEKNVSEENLEKDRYWYQPRPATIESTSYALLTYCLTNEITKGSPIAKWLSSKRNALGGFSSTQDTVMALQALGAFAELIGNRAPLNNTVYVKNGADEHNFELNSENSFVLQSYELSNLDHPVELTFEGTGIGFGQVEYAYNRAVYKDNVPFFCVQEVQESHGGNRLQLDLCCNYTKPGFRSNMAVAEIDALTGYQFDNNELETLTEIYDLQRAELDKDFTKMSLYFNPLGGSPVCFSLYSDMVYQVTDQKPAQFVLYDYYDPEQQLKTSYSAKQTRSLQDSCSECWPAVEVTDENLYGSRQNVSRSASRAIAGLFEYQLILCLALLASLKLYLFL
uniref:NTR domain-containing protein n=1 Tax=Syphacia muris TaxID=451379 RepID=A0A0N5A8I1_9BILA